MTYAEFIQNIIDTRGQWAVLDGSYFEMHHIKPRCLGGSGDYSNGNFKKRSMHLNCIWLFPREHFIAHKLLAKEYPNIQPLVNAYWNMCTLNKEHANTEITPEEYEEARLFVHNNFMGYWKNCIPENHPMYGKDRSGKNNPFYGKTFSKETRDKLVAGFKKWKDEHPEEFSKQQARPLGANPRAIAIKCVETDTRFECLKLAISWLKSINISGLDSHKIRLVLDTDDTAYGFHWITVEKLNYKKEKKKDHGWWRKESDKVNETN